MDRMLIAVQNSVLWWHMGKGKKIFSRLDMQILIDLLCPPEGERFLPGFLDYFCAQTWPTEPFVTPAEDSHVPMIFCADVIIPHRDFF